MRVKGGSCYISLRLFGECVGIIALEWGDTIIHRFHAIGQAKAKFTVFFSPLATLPRRFVI